jgi:uncharacterized protein (DUF1697 family)
MTDFQHGYIALLRAINVGGHSVTRMADLRGLFESLGLTEVVTYIQSGNVLFNSTEGDREHLKHLLEKKLKSSLGYQVSLFIFTRKQLEDAAAQNPFDPERRDKEQRCHLMFLSREPDADHCAALMALEGEEYSFFIHGKVLYYAYPREFEGSARRTINFERVLGVTGTARTWKVVNKLIELSR